jgi:hypothetical protein
VASGAAGVAGKAAGRAASGAAGVAGKASKRAASGAAEGAKKFVNKAKETLKPENIERGASRAEDFLKRNVPKGQRMARSVGSLLETIGQTTKGVRQAFGRGGQQVVQQAPRKNYSKYLFPGALAAGVPAGYLAHKTMSES